MPGAEQSSTVCQQQRRNAPVCPGKAGDVREDTPCEPNEAWWMSKSLLRGQTDWSGMGQCKYREEKE